MAATRKSLIAGLVIVALLVMGGITWTLPGPEGAPSWLDALVAKDWVAKAWADSDDDDDEDGFQGSAPLAKAGFDRTVAAGATVVLDGSGSVSPSGSRLTYAWGFAQKPAGSAALIDDPAAVKPSFVADLDGDYVVELSVSTGSSSSQLDSVTVSTVNVPPSASAGPDRPVALADLVVLDGSGSSDFDGDALSYSWSLVETPVGSAAALSDPSALRPTFFVDLSGTYVAELVVSDAGASSAPSRVTLSTGNLAPEPNAGPDISAALGDKVRVDSDGTSDADGDCLQARWKLIARPPASTATLSTPEGGRPRVTLDDPGVYVIQLRSKDETAKAFDSVTISTDNTAPVADAGPDQAIAIDQEVALDGGASSDVDGDMLSYRWALVSIPAGSTAVLDDSVAIRPAFTADLAGDYVAQLIVDDGAEASRADTVLLSTANLAPVADAGPDQTVTGNTVQLDGSGSSDANGDPLTFRWSSLSMTGDDDDDDDLGSSFDDPEAAAPTLTLSGDDNDDDGGSGLSLVQLFVNDGTTDSEADTLLISKANSRPVADAGADERVLRDQPVTLDGAASSDADNDNLTFQWALIAEPEGSAAALSGAATATPSFTPDLAGLYVAQLVVADAKLASRPDTVVIQANGQPVADAGADQTVDVGTLVTLDSSASNDPDGDPLTLAWTITAAPAGSLAVLSDPAAETPSFTPDIAGDYLVDLVVNDGFENSAPDTVTVTAEQVVAVNLPPVLEPIGDQSVNLGSTLSLTLEASDPNGDTLAFTATPLPLPDGASLNGATGAFSFTPNAAQVGDIALTFIVSDGVLTDQESVVITVVGAPPGGGTALSGRLLDANDFANSIETPVVGATISLLDVVGSTTTDANGDFLLTGIPAGSQIFDIDSSTANLAPDGSTYAGFREALELIADVTNDVNRPFFLPRIEDGSLTPVDPTVTTFVENTRLGVILEIAPFSAKNPDGTDFTGQISISEVPRGLAPAELPDFLDPGLLVTVQPVGVVFNPPAGITFPNIDNVPPGDIIQIWSLDPDRGTFDVTGIGEATADGASTVTIAGGIRRADWHGPFPPRPGPGDGDDSNDDQQNNDDECQECKGNSSVALHSGNLSEIHELVSYRSLDQSRSLILKYNSTTADPQPIVSSSTTILRRGGVPTTISGRIEVAGVDQGIEVFTSTSDPVPLSENRDERLRQVLQFDASDLETGVYPYRFISTNNYAATRIAGATDGRVLVDNRIDSPFGAGWDLDGLDRLKLQGSEGLLLRGDGAILRFGNFLPETVTEEIIPDILDFPVEPGRDFEGVDAFVEFDESLSPPADYNGDGITDFVVMVTVTTDPSGEEGLTFTEIFLGDGEGNFPSSRILQTSDTPAPCSEGCQPDTVAALPGEFNGDGIPDLVVVNSFSDEVRVFPGLTAGFYGSPASVPVTNIGRELAVADFDGDGNQDVVVGNFDSANPVVTVLFGDGTGALPTQLDFSGLTDGFITDLFPADLNGDGATDLVIGRLVSAGGQRRISVALNDGSGTLVAAPGAIIGFNLDEIIAPTDIDGDGDLDLVGQGGSSLLYFWNNGAGIFERDVEGRVNSAVISDATLPGSAFNFDLRDAGDLDDDGDADFLVIYSLGFSDDKLIVLYFNDGTGALPNRIFADTGSGTFINDATLDDINDDELIDVFTRRFELATTFLFNLPEVASGPGAGSFSTPAADFSILARNVDGSFTRRFKDGTRHEFDADGFITALVDRNENTTSHTFDSQGRLVMISDPAGLETSLAYAGGRLSSITDPATRTTLFEHDGDGNLVRITDPDGSVREFTYDERHRLVSQLSKRGFETSYDFAFHGRAVRANRPDGSTNDYETGQIFGLSDVASGVGTEAAPAPYSRPEDRVTGFTNGRGNKRTFSLNSFGGASIVVDALGRVTATGRNDDNDATRRTLPNGRVDELTYDNRGNLLTRTEAVGDPDLERATTFEYEPEFNKMTKVVDPANNATNFAYDANGNLTSITDALGGIRSSTYDSRGLMLTKTDENDNTTIFSYDTNGNLVSMTDAEGNVTQFGLDAAGNRTSTTEGVGSPVERTTSVTFDVMNRPTAFTDGVGATVQVRYDAMGNIMETETATGELKFMTFDELDRVVEVDDPVTGVTRSILDLNGNVAAQINSQNQMTTFEYDAADRKVKMVDALFGEQIFAYDVMDNLTSFQDEREQVTGFGYDLLNRRISETNALGQTTTFSFDSRDNPIGGLDAKGQAITNTFDALSRWTQSTTSDDAYVFTFDAAGNQIAASNNDSSLAFTYDGLNRLVISETLPVGGQPSVTLTATFDAVGNRVALADDAEVAAASTDFAYDDAGRPIQVTTASGQAIDLTYDPAGRVTGINYPNAVVSTLGYDLSGRLSQITHARATTPLAEFGYSYDTLGNILSIAEQSDTRTFGYDALERVTEGGFASAPESYAYDAVGNRTASHISSSHLTDTTNRLLEDDQVCYDYDANGNIATKTEKISGACTGGVTTHTYNGQDQLIEIVFPDSTTAIYSYDAAGRRIEKNVNGAITRYVYDGPNILLEFDGANTLLARYSHGDGADQQLAVERDGQTFFYHADQIGSVRRITDGAGLVVNAYEYDSYGRIETSSESIDNPFTFTGREFDAESGRYYYRARYYEPNTGRFLKEDPLGFGAGDSNLYRYVFNNPVRFTDPTGLARVLNRECFKVLLATAVVICADQSIFACAFCGPAWPCWAVCTASFIAACVSNAALLATAACTCETSTCSAPACAGIEQCEECPPES